MCGFVRPPGEYPRGGSVELRTVSWSHQFSHSFVIGSQLIESSLQIRPNCENRAHFTVFPKKTIGNNVTPDGFESHAKRVAVVGLGYVGLPLAVEFGKKFETIGYDLSEAKINHYRNYCDPTGEVSTEGMKAAAMLRVSNDPAAIARADFIIIAVPTPVDDAHIPDFSPLVGSSTTVGKHMKRGATVVYESTVYPGATEEVCIPLLEKHSGMKWKEDFHVGYSPERVNPGDKERTITKIVKVVSGDDGPTSEAVAALYASVIVAGVHRASSIKVAEAAKVIENTQRDLNIALMNELALIFDKIGIDTLEVLQAAGTKWNFLPFRPGLVGGHCIGVDPYYLTHKAEMLGYHPQVILAGRRINDGMAAYVAQQTVKPRLSIRRLFEPARALAVSLRSFLPLVRRPWNDHGMTMDSSQAAKLPRNLSRQHLAP